MAVLSIDLAKRVREARASFEELVANQAAFFEEAVLKALSQFPSASALLVVGNGINRIDTTGEEKLRALAQDLNAAGVTLMLAGLKRPVREALDRAGLIAVIGEENIFASKDIAVRVLDERFKQQGMEAAA